MKHVDATLSRKDSCFAWLSGAIKIRQSQLSERADLKGTMKGPSPAVSCPWCCWCQDFMVVAVAEGAGQKFVSTGKKDSPTAKKGLADFTSFAKFRRAPPRTGHTVYGDIGTYLKATLFTTFFQRCANISQDQVNSHLKKSGGRELALEHDFNVLYLRQSGSQDVPFTSTRHTSFVLCWPENALMYL